MRTLLTTLVLTSFLFTKGQSHLPVPTTPYGYAPAFGYIPWAGFTPYAALGGGDPNQKWQIRPYASMSMGYIFLNGAGSSYLAAQTGVALIHPLTKNISAFAGVSASPVLFSVNRLYTDPALNASRPGNGFSGPYNLGLNAGVQAGLIYTNDDKTFSISGSVGVERGSNPIYPVNRPPTRKP
jgi:hypothetical protein